MQQSTEDNDDAGLFKTSGSQVWQVSSGSGRVGSFYLDDEHDNWVFRVVHRRIGALKNATLVSSADTGGRSGRAGNGRGHGGGKAARHGYGTRLSWRGGPSSFKAGEDEGSLWCDQVGGMQGLCCSRGGHLSSQRT